MVHIEFEYGGKGEKDQNHGNGGSSTANRIINDPKEEQYKLEKSECTMCSLVYIKTAL